ncbi:MAG: pyridoxamine 5'-phosphate oxidase family protein [Planctomycetota bacterium]|jgi:predicted pyridoxine 5'-phosphate oxidase superfamily flavin-nucleotide-binding protein
MSGHPSDVAFSPAVKAQQERLGSRRIYEKMGSGAGWDEEITEKRAAYIRERDSVYIATASADGRPYIQHRGGPRGFLKILDEKTLAFAEYAGNRQYISMGNLSENDRACLFLMDYPNRQRLKIWGRAEFVEDDPELMARVVDPNYPAKHERAFVFHVEVMDGNCPQHIQPRFTMEEMGEDVAALKARIKALEAQVASCCPG